ncbi:MAG: hypothetical protein WCL18_01265 [bacterium]
MLPEIRDQVSENLTKAPVIISRKSFVAPKIDRGVTVDGRYYSD